MTPEIPGAALRFFSSRVHILSAVHAVVLAIDEDAVDDYRELAGLGEPGLLDAALIRPAALRMRWTPRTMELSLLAIDQLTRAIGEEEVSTIVRREDGMWMHFPPALVERGRSRIARRLGGTTAALYSQAGVSLVGYLLRRFPPPADGAAVSWLAKVMDFVCTNIDSRFWMACVPVGQLGAFVRRRWPGSVAAEIFSAAPPEEVFIRDVQHEPQVAAAALLAGRPRIIVEPWEPRPRWRWTARRRWRALQEYCRFRSSHTSSPDPSTEPSVASAAPRAEGGRARARRGARSAAAVAGRAFIHAVVTHGLDPTIEVREMMETLCDREPDRFQLVSVPHRRHPQLRVDGKEIEMHTCRNNVSEWRAGLGIDARRRDTRKRGRSDPTPPDGELSSSASSERGGPLEPVDPSSGNAEG